MAFSRGIVISLAAVLLLLTLASACQTRQGCRIQNNSCLCGIGCEYRYTDQQECRKALRGRRNDVCQRAPCYNGGSCIQSVSHDAGFKCRCEGTGFYGKRCEHACPRTSSLGVDRVENYPYECIVI